MKIALWIVFALLCALWTGAVLVSVELTGWLATTIASGQANDLLGAVGQWPVPAWVALWVDPVWLQELQAAWVGAIGWLGQSGPAFGSIVGWLIPMIWVVWSVVVLLLLLAAVAGHFMLGKLSKTAVGARNTA